jgi:hypothetical protein
MPPRRAAYGQAFAGPVGDAAEPAICLIPAQFRHRIKAALILIGSLDIPSPAGRSDVAGGGVGVGGLSFTPTRPRGEGFEA